MTLYLVFTHLGTDGCLFDREHTAKAAALVRTLWFNDIDAVHQLQQVLDFIKRSYVLFTG